MLASRLLYAVFDQIYIVVIGKLFSAADVGYFTQAKKLADIPAGSLSRMVYRVTFPVFSVMQDDVVRMKRALNGPLPSWCLSIFR